MFSCLLEIPSETGAQHLKRRRRWIWLQNKAAGPVLCAYFLKISALHKLVSARSLLVYDHFLTFTQGQLECYILYWYIELIVRVKYVLNAFQNKSKILHSNFMTKDLKDDFFLLKTRESLEVPTLVCQESSFHLKCSIQKGHMSKIIALIVMPLVL